MKTRMIVALGLALIFPVLIAQPVNRFIIIDQFGYLPQSKKIAVIKDPQTGFDAGESFSPGSNYVVVEATSGNRIFRGQPVIWKSGDTDESSGDKAWHFDFSAVTQEGNYYILDSVKNVRSYEFAIAGDVYREILRQAVRTFFYQRVGYPKDALYAGVEWADSASHMGPLQDTQCRIYNDRNNTATERNVSGGWYDAGDFNKYTSWTSNYVVEMMKAYIENPSAWGDDYNIPESGNGIPDLIDETKWGIDHLRRMQEAHGGVLCIVSEDHASPPSLASGQSVYGPATTLATFNTSAALALAARVFRLINMKSYADTLVMQAEKAWQWGVLNPAVIFHNNSSSNGSQGVGAGDQEGSDYDRQMAKLEAACFLYEATGNTTYRQYFDTHYNEAHMLQWNYAYPYETSVQDLLLYYTQIKGATSAVSNNIKNVYKNAMAGNTDNFPAYASVKDPYYANMDAYTWGSNNQKGGVGSMFYNTITYNTDVARIQDARDAAEGYVHYFHGVNPLNIVYLTNMYAFGGDSCVNEFYHTWFCNGSPRWDRVGTSLYGPPPGFVPGGPNPSYNWAGCCDDPRSCGSDANNAVCDSENLTPPLNQPKQKSYKDFNTSWPLNSWEVTENSGGYQVSYIRLLSKFVTGYDCNGDYLGTAYIDTCGICSGGNTGKTPIEEPCDCPVYKGVRELTVNACGEFDSPSGKYIWNTTGNYIDTLTSVIGCDSILHIALTVLQPVSSSQEVTACESFVSPSGNYNWNISGEYSDTLSASNGCDSIIFFTLTIVQPSDSAIDVVACKEYVSPGGTIWTETGTYRDTLVNYLGCDSIILVSLTITEVNTDVVQSADTLTALAEDATFRWLNCSDYTEIEDATGARFTPAESGTYAAEVSQSECVDTSACYEIVITDIYYHSPGYSVKVFPNPTSAHFTISLPGTYETTTIEIKNLSGQVMYNEIRNNEQMIEMSVDIPSGIYLLSIKHNNNHGAMMKLVIK